MPTRRASLGLGLSVLCGLAGCIGRTDVDSQTPSDTLTEGLPVRLETVTDRPVSPLAFAETPDGQYYVADRPGQIYLLDGNSIEPALDLSDVIVTGGERGLLGLALHPEFDSNGRLYVRYSASPRSNTPDSYSHTFVLAEFRVESDGRIDRDSEQTLLEIPEPQSNHNSGPIAFGPDGYLYVGVGDGGAGGDRGEGHVEDWYDANEGGNGQDVTENLLGSLLRIDVDDQPSGRPYGTPDDNPLVGREGLDEHYAWGLRNPWGISFDGTDLYVADVGQSQFEEVNRIERGGNYGWNVREGSHCYDAEECPETTPDGEPLRDPVVEYPHDGEEITGDAVVGGYVYRGSEIPVLSGRYVFGDLSANGRLFVATPTDDGRWPVDALELAESSRDKLNTLLMMERDRDGELYALSPSGVHRLVPSE
ncbi:PQQ-dependent sugar dehydrogenase [Halovenus marina]|uniref:PQQ-dependent sugar dehydrogenase n=1 Tax=Halovenus marina TaxID=3396621 RepID=UPI003F576123